jgi:hypothetical protein
MMLTAQLLIGLGVAFSCFCTAVQEYINKPYSRLDNLLEVSAAIGMAAAATGALAFFTYVLWRA